MIESLSTTENVEYAAGGLLAGLKPPPDMTISEWAAKYRILSGAASSSPGKWRNDRTPYLVEIMDQLSPQSPAQDIVFMKGAQVGGTECLINTALYYIMHNPCPIGYNGALVMRIFFTFREKKNRKLPINGSLTFLF